MAIDTAACKEAICHYFTTSPKTLNFRRSLVGNELLTNINNWKRVSKHGNVAKGFARKFENKAANIVVNVHSTLDEITEIKRSAPIEKRIPFDTFKRKVTEYLNETDHEPDDDIHDYEIVEMLEWDKLPQVQSPYDPTMGDEPGNLEPIDFENCGIVSLKGSVITVWAGGDWQEPLEFSGTIQADGTVKYNNDAVPVEEIGTEEFSGQQIADWLNSL